MALMEAFQINSCSSTLNARKARHKMENIMTHHIYGGKKLKYSISEEDACSLRSLSKHNNKKSCHTWSQISIHLNFPEMFTCRCSTFLPKMKMLWKLIWPNSTNSSRLAILYIQMYINVYLLYFDYSILDLHSWSKCLFLCPHVNCNDSTSGGNGVSWKVQCWSRCFNSRRLWGFRAHAQTLWRSWHHSST